MKTAYAFVFALASALTSLATPVPSPAAEPVVEARQEYCPIPPPNANVVDRIYRAARARGVNSVVSLDRSCHNRAHLILHLGHVVHVPDRLCRVPLQQLEVSRRARSFDRLCSTASAPARISRRSS